MHSDQLPAGVDDECRSTTQCADAQLSVYANDELGNEEIGWIGVRPDIISFYQWLTKCPTMKQDRA